MDLAQLEMFREVARHASIVRAAEAIHRVPSNVTTRIKQLEASLGVDLFIRENNRLRLSVAGHGFLSYANQILALADEARAFVSGSEPGGWFPLGSLESTAAVRIPPLLVEFSQRHPKVEVDLSAGASGEMIDGVASGRLMAAFVDGPISHPALDGEAVFEEEMVIIAPANHAPIKRGRDADGATLFAYRENCSYRKHLERWLAADGAAPGKIREIASYHSMVAYVAAGSGLAIMPRSMFAYIGGESSAVAWPMTAEARFLPTWLIWRSDTRNAALDAFRATIKARATR